MSRNEKSWKDIPTEELEKLIADLRTRIGEGVSIQFCGVEFKMLLEWFEILAYKVKRLEDKIKEEK